MKRFVMRWSHYLAVPLALGVLAASPALVSASNSTSSASGVGLLPSTAQTWTFIDQFQYQSDCIATGQREAAALGFQWMCVRDEPGYDLYVQ